MSLREYFCYSGIFHLEQFESSHSQQRLLGVLEIEPEDSFWHKREHLRVLDGFGCCLLSHCQQRAEGLTTDSMKVVRGLCQLWGPECIFWLSWRLQHLTGKAEALWSEVAVPSDQKHFPEHGNEAARRRKSDSAPAAEHAQCFLEEFGKHCASSSGISAHVGCHTGEPFLLLFPPL